MPTFFLQPDQVSAEGEVHIAGPDARHIARALRCVPGDLLTVAAEVGIEHEVRLDVVATDSITATIVATHRRRREPSARVHVLQALPKGQGMAEVCERLAEVGVTSIWPVITDRTIPRTDADQAGSRRERWQLIAREAAQLARRHQFPTVQPVLPLEAALDALARAAEPVQLLACDGSEPHLGLSTVSWAPGLLTAVVVGPEGGLSSQELAGLVAREGRIVSLGPRNLRTVLAASVATVILLARAGDLEPCPP